MEDKRKSWPAGTGKASKIVRPKSTKPLSFPLERLLRQAHWEIVQRVNLDPNPVKRPIAMLVAAAWKKSLMDWGAG